MPPPYPRRSIRLLAATLAGGLLLAPGVAIAASPTVAFNGGCGLLGVGASSRPDQSSVAVRTNEAVFFVNHLGEAADLMINGGKRATIPDNYQVSARFAHPASVTLVPGCLLGHGSPGAVTIKVVAPSPSAPAAVSVAPSVHSSGGTRHRSSPAAPATPTAAPAPVDHHPSAMPSSVVPSASTALTVPLFPSDPSDPALAMGDGAGGGANAADSGVAVGSAVPAPPVRRGPAGALVLIAVVCVVGVSIAAIRAIIAQRAIRAAAA